MFERICLPTNSPDCTAASRFKQYSLLTFNEFKRVPVGSCGLVVRASSVSEDYVAAGLYKADKGELEDRV
jgi:hypothetical protein